MEGTRSLDVMKLARAGLLSRPCIGTTHWSHGDGTTASIQITGGRQALILDYRVKVGGEDWQIVQQRVPIRWTACGFGGERPWFVCDVAANGVYCGRQVAKLYSAGRLFACRHCYRLGYQVQRGGPTDRAHHRLARLHRRLGADYRGSDGMLPQRPRWMRQRTYERVVQQIEASEYILDVAFVESAQRMLARIERSKQRSGLRR